MKKESTNLEYLQPMVKVLEIKSRQVLCSSITDMTLNGTEQTDGPDGDFV